MPTLLSQNQLDDFARDGFLLIKGLIPPEELKAVQQDSADRIDCGTKEVLDDPAYVYGTKEDGAKVFRRINQLFSGLDTTAYQELYAYPPLLTAISDAVGSADFACTVASLVFKVPGHGFPVPWHQDPVDVYRFPVFNVDVYLDHSHEENGCLWAIPGSHLCGLKRDAQFMASWTGGKLAGEVSGAVPVIAEPGDVLFHATTVIHGSWWNRSDSLRRTVYFHIDTGKDIAAKPVDFENPLRVAGVPEAYKKGMAATKLAIAQRKRRFPEETPFEYTAKMPVVPTPDTVPV